MIELAAAHFCAQNPRQVTVANRTVERAQSLAERIQGQAIRLSDLPDTLAAHDIVISCTASSLPIIGLGLVERALKTRRHRPIFMIDLAVPRDIEAEVARLDDVFLYTVDDLGRFVQTGIESRQMAVAQAESIIDSRVHAFMDWMQSRQSVPVIRTLHARGDAIRQAELERARRMLARGDDPDTVLEALASGLTGKFLHGPTTLLQRHGSEEHRVSDLIARLLPDTPSH